MSTTLVYFEVSKRVELSKQLGRLTLAQACELLDAVSAVVVVCKHTFAEANREVPSHYIKRLNALNLDMSLAQARDVLTQWRKRTHQFHGEGLPNLLAIDLFLMSEPLKTLAK